jgi:hypothetical protein
MNASIGHRACWTLAEAPGFADNIVADFDYSVFRKAA